MLGDNLAVLADDDQIGIGPHVDRPAYGASRDAVLVARSCARQDIVVEAHQAGLRHRHLAGMEAVEGAAVRHQEGPLLVLPRAWPRDGSTSWCEHISRKRRL